MRHLLQVSLMKPAEDHQSLRKLGKHVTGDVVACVSLL